MSQRRLVAIADHLSEASVEKAVLDPLAEVITLQATDAATVVQAAPEVEVVLVHHVIQWTERALGQLSRLKAIVRCGVGFDNIDIRAAGLHGIVVCHVPDYGTEEVADHALLLLLALARRLLPCHEAIRAGGWDLTQIFGAPRLRGRTLGIIGCGRIGTAMALRAKALGLRVVVYDPYKPDGLDKMLGVERAFRLEELLPQAEFLTLHCPLTRETRHLLNPRTLSLLPKGAYVINTARGPCIQPAALRAALDSGQVAGAGLDVFEIEPLDDEALRSHPRVILTPHAAFYSVEGYTEMRRKGAEEARRVLQAEPVRNPVNLHCLVNARAVVLAAGLT